jgi:hypothetical protein
MPLVDLGYTAHESVTTSRHGSRFPAAREFGRIGQFPDRPLLSHKSVVPFAAKAAKQMLEAGELSSAPFGLAH